MNEKTLDKVLKKVFTSLSESEAYDFLLKLKSYLKFYKKEAMLKKALLKISQKTKGNGAKIKITSYEEIPESLREEILKEFLEKEDGGENVEWRIDETLIGGYVIDKKAKRLDRSYKNKLLELYRETIGAIN